MKPRLFITVLIFVSAYSPLALIMLIKDYNLKTWQPNTPWVSVSAFIISLLAILALLKAMRDIRGGDAVTVTKVSNKSGELVNYTIPYIASFFGFDLSNIQELASLGVFMLMMYLLSVRTENIFINPILSLAGYSLFDVTYQIANGQSKQAIFLSKFDVRNEEMYTIRRLSRFLFFVTKENPKD
mgnify:CR=1 FL=1